MSEFGSKKFCVSKRIYQNNCACISVICHRIQACAMQKSCAPMRVKRGDSLYHFYDGLCMTQLGCKPTTNCMGGRHTKPLRAASHYTISVVRWIRSDGICHDGSSYRIVANDCDTLRLFRIMTDRIAEGLTLQVLSAMASWGGHRRSS